MTEAMRFTPPGHPPVAAGDLPMIRTALVAAVVAAVVAAGWGCTQSPGGLTGINRSPSARLAQLERELADLKDAQARLAAESAANLASLTAERQKAAGLAKERDDLKAGLAARTVERDARQAERDAARAKFDGFHRELKELLSRVEGGPSPAVPVSAGF